MELRRSDMNRFFILLAAAALAVPTLANADFAA